MIIIYLIWVAALPFAEQMARSRGRSSTAWLLTTVVIGPLGPLALLFLGKREDGAHQA